MKSEGTEKMDGVDVTHVSADVNSAKAITDVVKAMDRTGQVPAGAEARLAGVVKNGHLDAWVGDDKIMRRVSLELSGKGDRWTHRRGGPRLRALRREQAAEHRPPGQGEERPSRAVPTASSPPAS